MSQRGSLPTPLSITIVASYLKIIWMDTFMLDCVGSSSQNLEPLEQTKTGASSSTSTPDKSVDWKILFVLRPILNRNESSERR